MPAVAFELGISLGDVSKVRFARVSVPSLDDAFTWFVQCVDDVVTVHARYDGRVQEIGRAAWVRGRLIERASATPDFPSDQQWKMVGTALGRVLRRAAAGDGATAWRRAIAAIDPSARRMLVGAIVVGIVAIGVAVMLFVVRTDEPVRRPAAPPVAPAPAAPPVAPAPAVPAPSATPARADVTPAPTFADAIARARPALGDGADNAGAWELARYDRLVWTEVANGDETTVPLVLKDSDRERGKKLCVTGTIADIERRDVDRRPVYAGALRTTDGDDVRFVALGSTGMLVKRSTATLCGVATGKHERAAVIVGMFDLPENRTPAVER